jgi:hypothetical protein
MPDNINPNHCTNQPITTNFMEWYRTDLAFTGGKYFESQSLQWIMG